ncbi:MAG: zinc ribbon domain-containing protein [Candidatus Bathyarchaeia archaeon]
MQKGFIDIEKSFSKATFVLLFLSILTLAVIITPMAKAQSQSVTVNPSQGPAGSLFVVQISGFTAPNPVSISLGTANVGTLTPSYSYNVVSLQFTVPSVSPGTYTVTATGNSGEVATTTFEVTQALSTTKPTSTPTGSTGSTGTTGTTGTTGLSPTNVPVTVPVTVNGGFWSPITIAVTAAVIALAFFMTAVYLKRGRQKPSSYGEASPYEPRPSTPSKTPYTPSRTNQPATKSSYQPYSSSRINQPATTKSYQTYSSSRFNQPATTKSYQPYSSSRINQPATNRPQAPYTKICPHCKRPVRDDQNICPYCSKRIR